MKVFSTNRIPIKSWCPDVEDGALTQAENLANLPFLFKHVALMSDCHQGYDMPIGGVIATKGVIIPNAVGVDIGCGMSELKTLMKSPSKKSWAKSEMRFLLVSNTEKKIVMRENFQIWLMLQREFQWWNLKTFSFGMKRVQQENNNEVMNNQKDLVEIVVELKPLGVIKG